MAQLSSEELLKYAHSPVHYAVGRRDYAALERMVSALPKLAKAGEIRTEAESVEEEQRAEAISAVIDRRDVPNRETPLHLAVRLGDSISAHILMRGGANWSLQNEQGWSSLQEAICGRQQEIATVIMRHYQPMAWAKWCRRLPRLIACMRRMRDFYMEIGFQFESSVIPFVGRIAPSDTYRIWKRDANLRADMTLAGFDGFRIQRTDQSFLFLGEGSDDGRHRPGSLLMLTHRDKEITNAFEDAGRQPSEAEVAQETRAMAQANVYRPGIDVTRAELAPVLNWRRQQKAEAAGDWKAKVYEMQHVMLSFKSRRVPGAEEEAEEEAEDLAMTEEERRQVEDALRMGELELHDDVDGGFLVAERPDFGRRHSCYERGDCDFYLEKKERFGGGNFELRISSREEKWRGRRSLGEERTAAPPGRGSLCVDGKAGGDLFGSRICRKTELQGRRSLDAAARRSDFAAEDFRKKRGGGRRRASAHNDESVYKKGLRPLLWLTPHFPLRTEELLPLLDILASKVKAVRRLRELLTTKLPPGTFPVKVAIPVVPTIRVVITFTKFEELPPSEEFRTPLSSPEHLQDIMIKESQTVRESSNTWFQWLKGPLNQGAAVSTTPENIAEAAQDPFAIPSDYTWTTIDAKKRQMKGKKSKTRKGKRSQAMDTAENGIDR